jgi:hypothetical protein
MWMVDDGPLDVLARLSPQSGAWPKALLNTTETTADAANDRRRALLRSGAVAVHSISMGTDAWKVLFEHLRKKSGATTANQAEHEAIAICLCERPDLSFVAQDKLALSIALAELGRGRVAHSFDLWEDLRGRGVISPSDFDVACEATRKSDQSLPGIPWRLRTAP